MVDLESFIFEKMSDTHLPGLSIALVRAGEVVYQRGFGLRDIERGLPVTPQTLIGIGSITKSFTCLALLQLQEQSRLSVNDPVEKYLPVPLRPHGEPIRLWHLMSHTSGIPALAYAEAVIRAHQGSGARHLPMGGIGDMLTFLSQAGDWLETRPGERWFYLNEGYALLGAIIEQVSGVPYPQYVSERILLPLGMDRSYFDQADVAADADAAVPYVVPDEGPPVPGRYTYGQVVADGGLISSAADMARYAAMYLAGGAGARGPIVSPASLQSMLAPRVALPMEELPPGGAGEYRPAGHYGYGLHMYPDFFGHTLVGHGGSVLVATAQMALIPERGLGAVVLANGSGYSTAILCQYALAVLLGEDPWQLPALHAERVLGAVTGTYETYRGTMQATVTRKGDFLELRIRDRYHDQKTPLVPLALDPGAPRFFTLSAGRRLPVEFHHRDGGVDLLYERYKLRRTGPAF